MPSCNKFGVVFLLEREGSQAYLNFLCFVTLSWWVEKCILVLFMNSSFTLTLICSGFVILQCKFRYYCEIVFAF